MSFWTEASPAAKKALVAASLGWRLDAFDVMLYALILTAVVKDLGTAFEQEIPENEVVILEEASHFLYDDEPERCAREVAAFLSRQHG